MKNYICVPMLFLVLCVEAQNISNDSFSPPAFKTRIITRVEVIGGTSIIMPHGTESFNEIRVPKWELVGGVGLRHTFNSWLNLGLNILYEDKGYRLEINQKNEDYTPPADQKGIIDITFNYVTASLLLRYVVDKRNRLYIGTGPYYGYLFSEKILTKIYINGSLVSKSTYKGASPYDNYKKHDIGATAMIGYEIKLKSRVGCNVQLMYNLGLMNVALPNITSMTNTTYALHFGFYLKNGSEIRKNGH